MTDEEKAVLRDLSIYLEQTIDTVIENQRFLVTLHKTLVELNPDFPASFARHLDQARYPDTPSDINQKNAMWEASAKKILHRLREL